MMISVGQTINFFAERQLGDYQPKGQVGVQCTTRTESFGRHLPKGPARHRQALQRQLRSERSAPERGKSGFPDCS